jgi:hypothetical protein
VGIEPGYVNGESRVLDLLLDLAIPPCLRGFHGIRMRRLRCANNPEVAVLEGHGCTSPSPVSNLEVDDERFGSRAPPEVLDISSSLQLMLDLPPGEVVAGLAGQDLRDRATSGCLWRDMLDGELRWVQVKRRPRVRVEAKGTDIRPTNLRVIPKEARRSGDPFKGAGASVVEALSLQACIRSHGPIVEGPAWRPTAWL